MGGREACASSGCCGPSDRCGLKEGFCAESADCLKGLQCRKGGNCPGNADNSCCDYTDELLEYLGSAENRKFKPVFQYG